MRRSKTMAGWILVCALGLGPATLLGCEDQNDPHTWVQKLPDDAKRPGATDRLRRLFQETMAATHPPNNPHDPAVQHFLDTVLPPLVTTFNAHPDDNVTRQGAIEILAECGDPRAIPALIGALQFHPNNGDSERLALRAVQALKEMAPTIPEAQKPAVVAALLGAIDRAQGNTGNPQQIRYNAIGALGALHATAAVDTLVRLLTRPLADQDISTARGAADALGAIGDPRGVDALIYGLYLNIRAQNAFNNCVGALGRLGAAAAVPKLVQTLQGQNAQVTQLIAQYTAIPNAPPPPEGVVQTTAADVLRAFASPDSTAPLIALLSDHTASDPARSAAGEALSYIAVAQPTQRAQILSALTTVFNENGPTATDHAWMASLMAPRLAVIGDPTSVAVIVAALRNRAIQDPAHANTRVDLLLPFASIARHGDVATFDAIAGQTRSQLQAMVTDDPGAQHEVGPFLALLTRLDGVISVARDCTDGDRVCYQGKLNTAGSTDIAHDIVRKAAYMIAWTTPPDQYPAARAAILAHVDHPDMLVRRSLMVALDRLSPQGCPECVTQLTALIAAEHGQESRSLSHLDTQLLIERLQARAAAPH